MIAAIAYVLGAVDSFSPSVYAREQALYRRTGTRAAFSLSYDNIAPSGAHVLATPDRAPLALAGDPGRDFLLSTRMGHSADDISEETKALLREKSKFPSAAYAIARHSEPIILPVLGVPVEDLADNWGEPRSGGRLHEGLDIFAPSGTPVVAAAAGKIVFKGYLPLGGYALMIDDGTGTRFYYAHLSGFAQNLAEGDDVVAGETIGFIGLTGNAVDTRPHLHFGMYDHGVAKNPYVLITDVPVHFTAIGSTKSAVLASF